MKSDTIYQILNVVIFEDDEFDLRAIQSVLNEIGQINILGVYDTMQEALIRCEELRPDLIIADADIRGDKNAGPRFVKNITKKLPKVKVLGLTKYPESITPLEQAGCQEAVLKSFFHDGPAAKKFIQEALLEPLEEYDSPPILSAEEDRVLRMIANGRGEHEIANALGKTRRQVKDIKTTLKHKFGVDTMKDPQLIAHAYQLGCLKAEEDLSKY